MALFSTRNLRTSTLLAFANKAARRNLADTFKAISRLQLTGIIQKRRTGFLR